jgi:transcriptional regulator with XRE-family HTH domain
MYENQLEGIIKELAKEKRYSIRQLCKKIEISETGLYKTLKNNTLKVETLQKIADVLEVPITYFFERSAAGLLYQVEQVKNLENQLKIATQTIDDYRFLLGMLKALKITDENGTIQNISELLNKKGII